MLTHVRFRSKEHVCWSACVSTGRMPSLRHGTGLMHVQALGGHWRAPPLHSRFCTFHPHGRAAERVCSHSEAGLAHVCRHMLTDAKRS